MKINLGCGMDYREGWVNIDQDRSVRADMYADLNRLDGFETFQMIEPNVVTEIACSHVLEHLTQPLRLLQALYRVASPVCKLTIRCPHGASDDAWEDQTHVRAYFPGSFQAFGQPYYWRTGTQRYTADWQCMRVILIIRQDGLTVDLARLIHERNHVLEMVAELEPVKPSREKTKELLTGYPVIVQNDLH